MEVESKGQPPVFVRTEVPRNPAGGPAGRGSVADKVARSIAQAQVAIDIRTGLAEARRSQAERQVASIREQADKLRVLSVVAPAAFAEFVNGLSRQLAATVSAYAQGGDPAAIRQQVRSLAERVVSLDQQGLGATDNPGEAAPAAQVGSPDETGASWQDLVTEVKAWLAEDDARLAADRQGWLASPAAAPEAAQDRQLVKDAQAVQKRLDLLFATAWSRIEDDEAARSLAGRQGRTTDRLDDAIATIDGWSRGVSRPPAGGLSILA